MPLEGTCGLPCTATTAFSPVSTARARLSDSSRRGFADFMPSGWRGGTMARISRSGRKNGQGGATAGSHTSVLIVIAGRQKGDPVGVDTINEPVFLCNPARPRTGQLIFERLGFSQTRKRAAYDIFHERHDTESDLRVGPDPIPEVLAKLRIEDCRSISLRGQDRTLAGFHLQSTVESRAHRPDATPEGGVWRSPASAVS